MSGTGDTGAQTFQLLGSAPAIGVTNGSHLFFVPTSSARQPDAYLSIVVAEKGWPIGLYTNPLTGALAVTTDDDCYELQLTNVADGAFRLEITDPGVGFNGEYYLHGSLDAVLPSRQGREPLRLSMTLEL